MKKSETLFFTGHRNAYHTAGSPQFNNLKKTISSFIDKGYKYFISGGAVGFDQMAAECVLALKSEGAEVSLIFMLPCKNQDAKWSESERRKYRRLLAYADEIIYISEEYTAYCMHARDRAMADASSACIAYCKRASGGTAYTVEYTVKKGIPVTNLALGQ